MSNIVTGYKATDENMRCRGYQFELGKWHKHDGDLCMCISGFHFCEYPSGPRLFYPSSKARIFRVEARGVLRGGDSGAGLKHVAKEIKLIEEITVAGNGNAGNLNIGHWNIGNGNAGNQNIGRWNTGHWNIGNLNTGHRNTGHRNTGDRNTGDGNIGDRHSGFFCKNPVKKVFFDEETDQPHDVHAVLSLAHKLSLDDQFEPTDQDLSIPNATRDKILALHKAHIEARRLKK